MSYYASLYMSMCIWLISILSMFLLISLTGIFSMGQAAFMSVGAYAAGLMCLRLGTPMWLNIIIAILAGMVLAWFVAIPVIKLRRDYIALVTLTFGEAIIALLNNATKFTGGSLGLNGIPRQVTIPMVTIALLFIIFLVINFKKSKFGRQCLAVKSDEISAAAMGIDVNKIKIITFVFAAAITAFAGSLWAYLTTYVEPNAFTRQKSIEWIIVVYIGGVNSLTGAILAGIILNLLPEFLRFTDNLRILIYCIIVIITINFMPRGLMGEHELTDIIRKVKSWVLKVFTGRNHTGSIQGEDHVR